MIPLYKSVTGHIEYSLILQARAAFRVCREFFDQPVEEKVKLKITKETNTSGYSRVEQEKLACRIIVCMRECVCGSVSIFVNILYVFEMTTSPPKPE